MRERKGAHGTTYSALRRDETGKQCSKTFSTKAAAKAFLKPRSAVPGYRAPVPRHSGTIAEYAAVWVEEHDLKPVARQTYRNHLSKHILPTLGRLQLAHVSSADIYTAVRKWQKAGMSPAQQAKCRTILSALFEDAVARGAIPVNPARGVRISRQAPREMRILSVEEYQQVLTYLEPNFRLLVRLAVASGARWGKLAELRGADLAGNTLTIARNVAELQNPIRPPTCPAPRLRRRQSRGCTCWLSQRAAERPVSFRLAGRGSSAGSAGLDAPGERLPAGRCEGQSRACRVLGVADEHVVSGGHFDAI